MSREIRYKVFSSFDIIAVPILTGTSEDLLNLSKVLSYEIGQFKGAMQQAIIYIPKNEWEDFKNSATILGYTKHIEISSVHEYFI